LAPDLGGRTKHRQNTSCLKDWGLPVASSTLHFMGEKVGATWIRTFILKLFELLARFMRAFSCGYEIIIIFFFGDFVSPFAE
jgi:hypothetical protein